MLSLRVNMRAFNMDALVIGAGLSGCVVARDLAEKGKRVVIWERRTHTGGNMYDYVDDHGILVHKYGPHTFHTTKKYLYDYMCQYEQWEDYRLTCGAEIMGKFTPTPFNYKTIDQFYTEEEAEELKQAIEKEFSGRKTATVVEVLNSENKLIREYGEFLFEHDYKLYTAKQWGIPAEEVDSSILKRVPLRVSYEEGYFDDEYQVMPKTSYTAFFANLLDHENIEVKLGIEARDHIRISDNGKYIEIDGQKASIPVIYTGALDELFNFDNGKLPYRSLRFEWFYENQESKQPYPVTAYPEREGFTRITEYKKLPIQDVTGTSYAVEYSLPYDADKKQEPYYPLLTEQSIQRASVYKERAQKVENLYFCGRLADFKYYNMDQALARALNIAKKIF